MRVVITDTGVDELHMDRHDVLPASNNILSKISRLMSKTVMAKEKLIRCLLTTEKNKVDGTDGGFKWRHWPSVTGYMKTYRRDSFFYTQGFGHIPQRAFKRHSAFLVYHKRYYQSNNHR